MTEDSRLKRADSTEKASRATESRELTENRELTDSQRLEILRSSGLNSILPDIPPIPGYHVCWLSTTNPRDSIPGRVRLGYTPVKPTDIPGFVFHESSINRGTAFGDCIAINEMIAFKLPEHLYQLYMREFHHNEPNRQESVLRETAERIRNEAVAKGADVVWEDGLDGLASNPDLRPMFSSD